MFESKVYKLVAILDHQGNSKVSSKPFYENSVGSITDNIEKYTPWGVDGYCFRLHFAQDAEGRWTNNRLRTSLVTEVREQEGRVEVVTANSIYVLEPAELPEPEPRDAANLIEMWLNNQRSQFCKGYYYDAEKQRHELVSDMHLGTTTDSCLISLKEDLSVIVCRYFPRESSVKFYNTIYRQQDYSTPMLIHNVGDRPLGIKFGSMTCATIEPGEEKLIQPPERGRQ